MTTRAVRNNNPGNIVAGDHWQGLMPRAQMTPAQAAEDRFAVFISARWGFRALSIILLNYARVHGIRTARQIISRFAPPSENDTGAYLAAFCKFVGAAADTPLDFTKPDLLTAACKAIAMHESGGWFFAPAELVVGVQMALQGLSSEVPNVA